MVAQEGAEHRPSGAGWHTAASVAEQGNAHMAGRGLGEPVGRYTPHILFAKPQHEVHPGHRLRHVRVAALNAANKPVVQFVSEHKAVPGSWQATSHTQASQAAEH